MKRNISRPENPDMNIKNRHTNPAKTANHGNIVRLNAAFLLIKKT